MRGPMLMHPAGEAGTTRGLIQAVAAFFRFLDPFAVGHGWEDDLRELATPHMAVLIHKRSRLMGGDLDSHTDPMRWARELGDFIDVRIWQYIGAAAQAAGKAKIFQTLDTLIAQEAAARAAERRQTPLTSRFDNAWAD